MWCIKNKHQTSIQNSTESHTSFLLSEETLQTWYSSAELILILFPETVSNRKELPAAFLEHLPHV